MSTFKSPEIIFTLIQKINQLSKYYKLPFQSSHCTAVMFSEELRVELSSDRYVFPKCLRSVSSFKTSSEASTILSLLIIAAVAAVQNTERGVEIDNFFYICLLTFCI